MNEARWTEFAHAVSICRHGGVPMKKNSDFSARMGRYRGLYLFILIPIIYYFVYRYYPIVAQFVLAFKEYRIMGGIWGSRWVGFANYRSLFTSPETTRIIINTIIISLLRLAIGFLPPIILAIFLFDMTSSTYRRIGQSILYIPHFFSWVVIYAIVQVLFSPIGYISNVIVSMGGKPKNFLMDINWFYPLIFGADLWKEIGWSTIIYLAALSNIDPQLYEAARVDGAGPIQRIIHITLPGILPVVVFCLTISLGNILNNTGTEQLLLFYSPATYSIADVIGTWVYRRGLGEFKYSLAAAVSQFNSVVGLILVLFFNKISKRFFGVGIW
jgi:putative aldouronate transport system permease protein